MFFFKFYKSGVREGKRQVSRQSQFWKISGLPDRMWCSVEPYHSWMHEFNRAKDYWKLLITIELMMHCLDFWSKKAVKKSMLHWMTSDWTGKSYETFNKFRLWELQKCRLLVYVCKVENVNREWSKKAKNLSKNNRAERLFSLVNPIIK